jgi:hypothetical protein
MCRQMSVVRDAQGNNESGEEILASISRESPCEKSGAIQQESFRIYNLRCENLLRRSANEKHRVGGCESVVVVVGGSIFFSSLLFVFHKKG